jgi:hypothetical protein
VPGRPSSHISGDGEVAHVKNVNVGGIFLVVKAHHGIPGRLQKTTSPGAFGHPCPRSGRRHLTVRANVRSRPAAESRSFAPTIKRATVVNELASLCYPARADVFGTSALKLNERSK